MALGKYSRVDSRKSPTGYCSTVTVVVFVALCLVGVWMMTSSSVDPVQTVDVSSQENKNDLKDRVSESNESSLSNENNDSNPKKFEDSSGDLPDEARKGDSNSEDPKTSGNENESSAGGDQAEKPENKPTESENKETKSKDTPKTETLAGEDKGQDEDSKNQEGNSKDGEKKVDNTDGNSAGQENFEGGSNEKKADPADSQKNPENFSETNNSDKMDGQTEKVEQNENKNPDQSSEKKKGDNQAKDTAASEVFPSGAQSELLNETTTQAGAWSTQAAESTNEKEAQKSSEPNQQDGYKWKLCNVTAGPDYIPCLDNMDAIRHLRSTKHYEHRERHCPDDPPTCLVPLPEGYQRPIEWPISREKIWYHNVPHTKLAEIKGHQNWVKVSGEYLTFPGGGTQFKFGALHYIDFIQQSLPDVAWGKQSRVVLDVGCGVASFGGFLFDRDTITMSLAPKDEHEAQVQFALERGIPALSAVMGTKRLPFPARVFDVIHCARCRVPWHIEGGKLLLELNRLLRPGGFFIWSATPVYQKNNPEDVKIWEAMKALTRSMCWEQVQLTKDKINKVGIAMYQKPMSNECYEKRPQNDPPLCLETDDPNASWNIPLQACMHKISVGPSERGSQWPEQWPERLNKPPYWLLSSQVGVYGKAAPEDFSADYEHWKRVVSKSYLNGMGISWSSVRNVMDMKAIYGGFAAALRDLNVWVMNVVPIDSPDTLPLIYERGLFGIYHDWCESFSTYPRSYDLLHADHLFSKVKNKCNFAAVVAEADRVLRPEGKLIVRDKSEAINELESLLKAMHWEIRFTYSRDNEGILCAQKSSWRPTEVETLTYAIA